MLSFPPCKINLGLHVLAKRADGYHAIETCFYPVPWSDILEVIRADKFAFTASGITVSGKEEDNLCVRAYRLLQQEHGLEPVQIYLHKIIPSGAGLGGGSSDAAHMLLLLNEVFLLNLSIGKLEQYAAQLGSDCAFFIHHAPMLGSGRGEVLHAVEHFTLKGFYIVLVKPPVEVSTAAAYAGVTIRPHTMPLGEVLRQPIAAWRDSLINDFEESIFKAHPEIGLLRQKLYDQGACYAAMSGSGSCVYGLFERKPERLDEFSGCTVWSDVLTV